MAINTLAVYFTCEWINIKHSRLPSNFGHHVSSYQRYFWLMMTHWRSI